MVEDAGLKDSDFCRGHADRKRIRQEGHSNVSGHAGPVRPLGRILCRVWLSPSPHECEGLVAVHYDPGNPSLAVIEKQASAGWAVLVMVGLAFVGLGLLAP